MPNIRMLTAQRELNEKQRMIIQGVLKARRSQEQDTQDVAKKTDKSEAERTVKKASKDASLADAEAKLASSQKKTATIGAVIGGIGALASIAVTLVKGAIKDAEKGKKEVEKVKEKVKGAIEDTIKGAIEGKGGGGGGGDVAGEEIKEGIKEAEKDKEADKKAESEASKDPVSGAISDVKGLVDAPKDMAKDVVNGVIADKVGDVAGSGAKKLTEGVLNSKLVQGAENLAIDAGIGVAVAAGTAAVGVAASVATAGIGTGAAVAAEGAVVAGEVGAGVAVEGATVAGEAIGAGAEAVGTGAEVVGEGATTVGETVGEGVGETVGETTGETVGETTGETSGETSEVEGEGQTEESSETEETEETDESEETKEGEKTEEGKKPEEEKKTEENEEEEEEEEDDDDDDKKEEKEEKKEKPKEDITDLYNLVQAILVLGGAQKSELNPNFKNSAGALKDLTGQNLKEGIKDGADKLVAGVTDLLSGDKAHSAFNKVMDAISTKKGTSQGNIDKAGDKVDSKVSSATQSKGDRTASLKSDEKLLDKAGKASSAENMKLPDSDPSKVKLDKGDMTKLQRMGIADGEGNIDQEKLGAAKEKNKNDQATSESGGNSSENNDQQQLIKNIQQFKDDGNGVKEKGFGGELVDSLKKSGPGKLIGGGIDKVKDIAGSKKNVSANQGAIDKFVEEKLGGKDSAEGKAFLKAMDLSGGDVNSALASAKEKGVATSGGHILDKSDVANAKDNVDLLKRAQVAGSKENMDKKAGDPTKIVLSKDENDQVKSLTGKDVSKGEKVTDKDVEKAQSNVDSLSKKVGSLDKAKGEFNTSRGELGKANDARAQVAQGIEDLDPLIKEQMGAGWFDNHALDIDKDTGKLSLNGGHVGTLDISDNVGELAKTDPAKAANLLKALEKTPGMEGIAGKVLSEISPEAAKSIMGAKDENGKSIISDGGASMIKNGLTKGTIGNSDAAEIVNNLGGENSETGKNLDKMGNTEDKALLGKVTGKDGKFSEEKLKQLEKTDPQAAQRVKGLIGDDGSHFDEAKGKVDAGGSSLKDGIKEGKDYNDKGFFGKIGSKIGDGLKSAYNGVSSAIGGAFKSDGESKGFLNEAILGMNMAMPAIQFMLQQLDKMREAEERMQEAIKKRNAARKAMADILKGMRTAQGGKGEDGGGGGGLQGAKAGIM
jgi:hypothetical protein